MAQLEVTYGLGDTVYTLAQRVKIVPATCAACGSTGKITLNGEEFPCPKCQGVGHSTGKEWYVASGMVQKISAVKCPRGCRARYTVLREGRPVEIEESKVYASFALATAAMPT